MHNSLAVSAATSPRYDEDMNEKGCKVYTDIGDFHFEYKYILVWMLWWFWMFPLCGLENVRMIGNYLDYGFPAFIEGLPAQGANNWLYRPHDSFRKHPLDPSLPGEYEFINDSVQGFLANNWVELAKPAFRDESEYAMWLLVKPKSYTMPDKDLPVCYNSVMLHGVPKKDKCRVVVVAHASARFTFVVAKSYTYAHNT